MVTIRTQTWRTDRLAWASLATGLAAMALAVYIALTFDGYEDTTAIVAPLVRLRVPLFLAASASAVAGPLVVTIGQWLDGRASRPSRDKPKAWSLEDL